jgi:acyl carrier protein
MTIPTLTRRASTLTEGFLAKKIRTFIAEHLGTDADSISVDSHFRDDLGLDLLDVVELTILVEEEFTNGEITDAAAEIEFVGDLVQHIEVYQSCAAVQSTAPLFTKADD